MEFRIVFIIHTIEGSGKFNFIMFRFSIELLTESGVFYYMVAQLARLSTSYPNKRFK